MSSSNSSHSPEAYVTQNVDEAAYLYYSGIPVVATEALSPARTIFSFPRDSTVDRLVVDYRNSASTLHVELHRYVSAKQEILAYRKNALASYNGGGGR